jgi:hypothetical protein
VGPLLHSCSAVSVFGLQAVSQLMLLLVVLPAWDLNSRCLPKLQAPGCRSLGLLCFSFLITYMLTEF